MPRPVKPRWVFKNHAGSIFGPMETSPTGELCLSVEGMEALRLSDHEKMDQDAAATLMGVSRQTYGRILSEARGTVAHALTTGKALRVGGGNYRFRRGEEGGGGGGRHLRKRGGRYQPDETARKKGEMTMPRGDGKGPDGQGPIGKGKGRCGVKGRGRCQTPGSSPKGGAGGRRSQDPNGNEEKDQDPDSQNKF